MSENGNSVLLTDEEWAHIAELLAYDHECNDNPVSLAAYRKVMDAVEPGPRRPAGDPGRNVRRGWVRGHPATVASEYLTEDGRGRAAMERVGRGWAAWLDGERVGGNWPSLGKAMNAVEQLRAELAAGAAENP